MVILMEDLPNIYIKHGNGDIFGGSTAGSVGYLGDDPLTPHGHHYIDNWDKTVLTRWLNNTGVEVKSIHCNDCSCALVIVCTSINTCFGTEREINERISILSKIIKSHVIGISYVDMLYRPEE